jgi:hypothetical protein
MEIDSKTIPSPPSAVQREKDIIPVAPVDMFRDIAVGHKRSTYTHSARGKETYKPLKAHSEKAKRDFSSYPSVVSHFIDAETPCLREATREPV